MTPYMLVAALIGVLVILLVLRQRDQRAKATTQTATGRRRVARGTVNPISAPADMTQLRRALTADPSDVDARYQLCMLALQSRDTGLLHVNASRTILDLARRDDYDHIAELYKSMDDILVGQPLPLTDAAFSEVAASLKQRDDGARYVALINRWLSSSPQSPAIPELLLTVAAFQRQGGREDFARKTLQHLVSRYPAHPASSKARDQLGAPLDSQGLN